MTYLWPYLGLLALTIAIEILVALLFPSFRTRLRILLVICANLVSHPAAFLVFERTSLPWGGVELLVIGVEAIIFRAVGRTPLLTSLAVSAAANGTTALLASFL